MNKISTKSYPSSLLTNRGEYNLLITYSEIKENIIDKFEDINIKNNITEYSNEEIKQEIESKLKLKIYKDLSNNTTNNTLKYLFFHLRNAIYIKIRNNKVVLFQPFANALYKNNWSHNIKLDSNDSFIINKNYNISDKTEIYNYIKYKEKYFKIYQRYLINKELWWCNNIIINNEERKDIWGTHSLDLYKEILTETCKNHKINDIDFFINKRDHPLLKKDLTEPYDKLYPEKQLLDNIYQNQSYTPILSPYVDDKYADIPFIIPDDWKMIQNDYEYKILENISWKDKIETAFFRGSATGYPTLENNQRLQIAKLNQEWNGMDNLLNAGIVSFNSKDKVNIDRTVTFVKKNKLNIKLLEKVPMNEQIKYKYILSIAGHSGGINRISWLLQSGCLWLKIKPLDIIDATDSWYSPLLNSGEHYIEIKSDLSDLKEKILWCRENDDKCKEIVENAKEIYNKYFTKEGLMNYSAYILNSINQL